MALSSWTRDGVLISDSDPLFMQTLTLTDKSTVTSQLVLSSANISSLVGTYQCFVTDGNGQRSEASLIINGNNVFVNLCAYFVLFCDMKVLLICVDLKVVEA